MTTPKQAYELVKSGQWTGQDFDAWLTQFQEDSYDAGYSCGYDVGYDDGWTDTSENDE